MICKIAKTDNHTQKYKALRLFDFTYFPIIAERHLFPMYSIYT